MKLLLTIIARLALTLTVAPSFLYLFSIISADMVKLLMAIAMLAWFITAPLLQRVHEQDDQPI